MILGDMMTRKLTLFLLIGLIITPAHAWSPYFSAGGSLGLSLGGDNARSDGFSGVAGVRYKLANVQMRTEFEYANTIFRKEYQFQAANGPATHNYDLKTQMYLVNILATPRFSTRRSGIHFGLTAGATTYKRDLPDFIRDHNDTRTSFIYGATAGIGLNLAGNLFTDIGVRYLRTLDDDVIDNFTPYFNLRYVF